MSAFYVSNWYHISTVCTVTISIAITYQCSIVLVSAVASGLCQIIDGTGYKESREPRRKRPRPASGGAVDSRSAFAIRNESESVAESADIYPLVTIVLVVGYGIPKRKQDCGFSPNK